MFDFNSIKVRLKPKQQAKNQEIRKFQFHKGTIKTHQTEKAKMKHLSFQFHKGTIKTYQHNKHAFCHTYFNSIKVRLKHSVKTCFILTITISIP